MTIIIIFTSNVGMKAFLYATKEITLMHYACVNQ